MPHRGVFGFLGEWVTAEENAPACLETELKADYWYSPPKPPALVKPATTPCCRSPFLNQEEEIKEAPKLSTLQFLFILEVEHSGWLCSRSPFFPAADSPCSHRQHSVVALSSTELPMVQPRQARRWHLPFPLLREHHLSCSLPQNVRY